MRELKAMLIVLSLFILSNSAIASDCPRMPPMSEEDGSMSCPSGHLVSGIACSGRYCDNKVLQCCSYMDGFDNRRFIDYSEWISEETVGYATAQGFVGGISCEGRYCDNIRLEFVRTPKVRNTGHCYQLRWISEESPNYEWCRRGYFVSGISCSGRYCDNIRFTCCKGAVPGDPDHRPEDWLGDRWR